MGNGYTKLFSDIVDSSIWTEDSDIRVVWVTLLALADEQGFVRGSLGWLAMKSRVSEQRCKAAIEKFLAPDPSSRSVNDDGRRLQIVERGWLIINYQYFRNERLGLSTVPRKVYQREWMRKKRMSTKCQQVSTGVNPASVSVFEGVQGKSTKNSLLEQEIVEGWNAMASRVKLAKCLTLSNKRKKHLKERLGEPFFCQHWKEAIERIPQSAFCRGQNDRGWQADFDFFIRPDSVPKIIEGKYDNHQAPKPPTPQDKRDERLYRDIQSI